MSIIKIAEFLNKNESEFPELASALNANINWIEKLKNQRENVIHYKSKVVVFESTPLSFALMNAAGTEAREVTPNGQTTLALTSAYEFINSQMLLLHKFMHKELTEALKTYAIRTNGIYYENDDRRRISCIGVEAFKKINLHT